jgi:hypothetical protein
MSNFSVATQNAISGKSECCDVDRDQRREHSGVADLNNMTTWPPRNCLDRHNLLVDLSEYRCGVGSNSWCTLHPAEYKTEQYRATPRQPLMRWLCIQYNRE